MDILINYDENNFLKEIAVVENLGSTHVQTIIEEFEALGLGKLPPSDLHRVFNNTEDLVFDKLTGGELSLAGIKVNRAKAMEILEKPKGYEEFLKSIITTAGYLKEKTQDHTINSISINTIDSVFAINEAYEIIVKQEYKDKIQKSYKKYAKTEKAKKWLEFSKAIMEKYDELDMKKIVGSNGSSIGSLINEVISSELGQGLKLKVPGILRLNN